MGVIKRNQMYFIVPPRTDDEREILICRGNITEILVFKDDEGKWTLTDPVEFDDVYKAIVKAYQRETTLKLFGHIKEGFYYYLLTLKAKDI